MWWSGHLSLRPWRKALGVGRQLASRFSDDFKQSCCRFGNRLSIYTAIYKRRCGLNNLISFTQTFWMFSDASSLNQPLNACAIQSVLPGAASFNKTIVSWDTSRLIDAFAVFVAGDSQLSWIRWNKPFLQLSTNEESVEVYSYMPGLSGRLYELIFQPNWALQRYPDCGAGTWGEVRFK